jgi:hypothetical protein
MQHGKSTSLSIGANDISVYVTSVTFEQDNDIHDITTFGATNHRYLAGLIDGKLTVNGFWDKTATVGSYTVIHPLVGDSDGAAFIYGPEGTASGKVKQSGTIILESYSESAPVADMVTFTASFRIDGAVTTGTFS